MGRGTSPLLEYYVRKNFYLIKLILIIKMYCHHSYKIIKFHHILYLRVFA